MTLKEAVGKVLEGWTLPNEVRKILEEAYFAEPQRPSRSDMTWVNLTDEEREELMDTYDVASTDYAQAIEAKLKEKNT